MRTTALLLLACALPTATNAQSIRGRVVEDGTETPITSATIELLSPDMAVQRTVVSDSVGWFVLEPPAAGHYLLRPAHPSYLASRVDSLTVEAHEIVNVVLRMGRAAIPLAPLLVTARSRDRLSAFRARAERRAFGYFIQRDEIENRSAGDVTDLLRVTPGVRISSVRRGASMITTDLIVMRGPSGDCLANVFIDGFPARQFEDSSVDDMLTPQMLEGVEIYRSAAGMPGEFMTPMNSCGVVAFWTRQGGGKPFTWKRLGILAAVVGVIFLLTR